MTRNSKNSSNYDLHDGDLQGATRQDQRSQEGHPRVHCRDRQTRTAHALPDISRGGPAHFCSLDVIRERCRRAPSLTVKIQRSLCKETPAELRGKARLERIPPPGGKQEALGDNVVQASRPRRRVSNLGNGTAAPCGQLSNDEGMPTPLRQAPLAAPCL